MATKKQPPKKQARKAPAKGRAAPPAKNPLRGSSTVGERRVHTPEVAGSTPTPATTLQPDESKFVAEYLIDFNATRAYMAVHPRAAYGTARTLASRLLAKDNISRAIGEEARKTTAKLELTRERVLLETARLAFFDPRKMLHADGRPKALHELDDDTAAAIAGLDIVEERDGDGLVIGHVKKYKVAEKNASLERAAKILALFKEDNEQKAVPLAEAFAQFLGQLHQGTGARLPIAPAKARTRREPT